MTIVLVGGGSGGHIVPLINVAKELKKLNSDIKIVAICDKGSKFSELFKAEPAIEATYQVRAGKFRRYPADKWWQKLLDARTFLKNCRDVLAVIRGFRQAKKLLKHIKPAGILFKGGHVGVPVGLAAARLKIPFITHDSDTHPGLTNRIIGRWATIHATGMPTEFYNYPENKTVFTGTPISNNFKPTSREDKLAIRAGIGLGECDLVILVIGGSQGAKTLNDAFLTIVPRLMQKYQKLGIIHNAGDTHADAVGRQYTNSLLANERRQVRVLGFTEDMYRYSASADLAVTRSSATFIAEFAAQALPCIVVPGNLAGNHQLTNASHLKSKEAVVVVSDNDAEDLYKKISKLLDSKDERDKLAVNLHKLAKPEAAKELAELVLNTFSENEA